MRRELDKVESKRYRPVGPLGRLVSVAEQLCANHTQSDTCVVKTKSNGFSRSHAVQLDVASVGRCNRCRMQFRRNFASTIRRGCGPLRAAVDFISAGNGTAPTCVGSVAPCAEAFSPS